MIHSENRTLRHFFVIMRVGHQPMLPELMPTARIEVYSSCKPDLTSLMIHVCKSVCHVWKYVSYLLSRYVSLGNVSHALHA